MRMGHLQGVPVNARHCPTRATATKGRAAIAALEELEDRELLNDEAIGVEELDQAETQAAGFYDCVLGAIAKRRETLGLGVRQLARRARVSHSFLLDVESGRKKSSWRMLGRMCRALDTTLPQIVVTSVFEDADLEPTEKRLVAKLSSMLAAFPGARRARKKAGK